MAPRGGRGGGSSGSGSSNSGSSSSSCGSYNTWPCTSELEFMYGHRWRPLWSEAENYGQLVVACIWAAVLLGLLFLLIRATPKKPAPQPDTATPAPAAKAPRGPSLALRLGVLFYYISFVFLAVRYGIISSHNNVLIGYRYESSIVVLLQRLTLPLIFYGLYQLATPKPSSPGDQSNLRQLPLTLIKIPYLLLLAAYTILNVAYSVLDFLVSRSALESFKEDDRWSWRWGDRDFSLTMNKGMIEALKTSGYGTGFAPGYIRMNMYDFDGEPGYLTDRNTQVKVGLAADSVGLFLALGFFLLVAGGLCFGRGARKGRRTVLLSLAGLGMLLSTLFALIVTAYFVYWNHGVVTTPSQWFAFIGEYEESAPDRFGLTDYIPPAGFLPSYRATADGFPVIQALLGPFGVVLACTTAVWLTLAEGKEEKLVGSNGEVYGYYEKSVPPGERMG